MESPLDATTSASTTPQILTSALAPDSSTSMSASTSSLASSTSTSMSASTSTLASATSTTMPASMSTLTSATSTSILASTSTLASATSTTPDSTSTLASATSTTIPPASTSIFASAISTFGLPLTSTSASTMMSPSTSNFASTVTSAPVTASAVSTENSAAVFSFGSQLPKDTQQMKFQIGGLPSKPPSKCHLVKSPPSVTITPLTSRPTTSTGLFGSSVVAEASKAPSRFKFQTQVSAPSGTEQASRPLARQRATSTAQARSNNTNATKYTSLPGSSGHSRMPFPNLGPDVVIRPVPSHSIPRNPHEGSSKQFSHPDLQDSDIFQLLSGYRYLKDEVTSLKVQLIDSQNLMQEILNSFSNEVAKINDRLTSLEQARTEHVQGGMEHEKGRGNKEGRTGHGQGRTEHEQGRTGSGQGRIEVDETIGLEQGTIGNDRGSIRNEQGTIDNDQGRIGQDQANDKNDERELLSEELINLALTKNGTKEK